MPKPGDFIIVHMVEKLPVGAQFERHRLDWPLHITLAPWFNGADFAILMTALGETASAMQPFEVVIGEERAFGIHGEIPVNIIENQADIRELHRRIIQAVQSAAGTFESTRFIDPAYTAHITHHAGTRRHHGDVELIDDFHLIKLLPPNTCEVVTQFTLGNNHETAA